MALVIYRKLAALVAAAMASGLAASCTTPAGRPMVTENPTVDRSNKTARARESCQIDKTDPNCAVPRRNRSSSSSDY